MQGSTQGWRGAQPDSKQQCPRARIWEGGGNDSRHSGSQSGSPGTHVPSWQPPSDWLCPYPPSFHEFPRRGPSLGRVQRNHGASLAALGAPFDCECSILGHWPHSLTDTRTPNKLAGRLLESEVGGLAKVLLHFPLTCCPGALGECSTERVNWALSGRAHDPQRPGPPEASLSAHLPSSLSGPDHFLSLFISFAVAPFPPLQAINLAPHMTLGCREGMFFACWNMLSKESPDSASQ